MIQSHARSRPFDHPHSDHPPQNNRHDTSDDETVASRLQGLSEEKIGNRREEEICQHGVKRHNAGVFGDVERDIHD